MNGVRWRFVTGNFISFCRCTRSRRISCGGVVPRILVILCFVFAINLAAGGNGRPSPHLGYCDFDDTCDWSWNETDIQKVSAPIPGVPSLKTDASGNKTGHFLLLKKQPSGQLWSRLIPPTGSGCRLEMELHQVQMENGLINLIIQLPQKPNQNYTSWVSETRPGNNNASWNTMRFNLNAIRQEHQLVLEVNKTTSSPTSHIAIDNIQLLDCFPESTAVGSPCTEDMFRCNNGSCLNRTRVCDLTLDCADGEDEAAECDKMPPYSRCNFESGWCGWTNVPTRPLNWTLQKGPVLKERTGPSYDHTYRNISGTYAYMNMSKKVEYASRGTIASPIFNPTPPYSSNKTSKYYNSCQIRLFYHQFGVHSGSLAMYLVQIMPHQNQSDRIWWSYGDQKDIWYNQAVVLPAVNYKYFIEIEASKGMSSQGDVAIDDISWSPECFGIGVPPDVVKDFNYYNPIIESEIQPEKHADFINKTVVKITTCGQTDRMGPTLDQCRKERGNDTEVELLTENVLASIKPSNAEAPITNMRGIQNYTVPKSGFYTIIGFGARGGRGAAATGSSLGALARGVVWLDKGEHLYFMIGQPGSDACPKNLGMKNHECQQSKKQNQTGNSTGKDGIFSKVREIIKTEMTDGGGGGGGATYIFQLTPSGDQKPLLIAAGGGGLGPGQFNDDGIQHGKAAPEDFRFHENGEPTNKKAGGKGGSWTGSWKGELRGKPLVYGGTGGLNCGNTALSHGNGGFGGGGGGCLTGGGGGGYIGGNSGIGKSGNGEGGYSYVAEEFKYVKTKSGVNQGPGEAFVIPSTSGCGCDFRCVALDQHLSETTCICPTGWMMNRTMKHCFPKEEGPHVGHQTFMIILIIASIGLLFAFAGLCLLLYNRYQNRKAVLRRRKVIFGNNGTELTALRNVSDNIISEYNPNYEFAGNLYSFKDLPQIPRDNISLVKPLGQGAFGEVFQGIYKNRRRSEEHPVAVKTLPSVSTQQAEADFMMEALIMSKFDHPNIVHFIGVSFDKNPRYIVLELLAGGDLKNFLREERPRPDRRTVLSMQDLIMCAYDVANGCKYMEDARFIHRDIAARNCLLTTKGPGRIVKIADFGMARDIYRSDYYKKGGKAMLPIKWMPPESFLDGIFTTKTDVWAFGVLLWEIMSFGYMPYTGCANREVMSMVTSGGRLERPAGCPDPIYGIMTQCWHPSPENRPSFATIVERIGYCLQDPDVINHPMPNHDVLPICDREITIMRPDPETECINVHPDLDGCGYVQPRVDFLPGGVRVTPITYSSTPDEKASATEEVNVTSKEVNQSAQNSPESGEVEVKDEEAKSQDLLCNGILDVKENGVDDGSEPEPTLTNPNVNGILRKSALKAALSLDPSTLCRGTIPYEKIAFSTPARLTNSDNIELQDTER